MIYRIRLDDTSVTRRRSDAAILQAERLAYDRLKAHGMLDTLLARKVMDNVQSIDTRKGGTVDVLNSTLFFSVSRS